MVTIKVTIVDWIRFLLTLPLSATRTHLVIMSCVTSDLFLVIAPFSSKSGQNMIYRQGYRLGVSHPASASRKGVNVARSLQPLLAPYGWQEPSWGWDLRRCLWAQVLAGRGGELGREPSHGKPSSP